MISNKILLCPVTAVQFINDLILTGEGSYLHIYCRNTGNKLLSCNIFTNAVIHGIRPIYQKNSAEALICVFGSKQFRILQFDHTKYSWRFLTEVIELVNWIWDITWLTNTEAVDRTQSNEEEDGNVPHWHKLACVLGHNSVVHIDVVDECIIKQKEVHCEEKCIIYCACCIGQSWESLVVASGTVFNQVVLWRPIDADCDGGRSKVLHRLVGHEGVIFSIDYNFEKNLLASVSDDRSIRLWKIQSTVAEPILNSEESGGYLSGDLNTLQLENVKFMEHCVWYGHKARVWGVKILREYVITIGEDATCCVWSFEGQVVMKYKGHKGKSIWSLAVSEDEKYMVTGGGDCSVRLWSLSSEDVAQNLPKSTNVIESLQLKLQNEDFPRIVALLNQDKVLAMTNEGILWRYDLKTQGVEKVMEDEKFKSYSILSCRANSSIFAVGNIHGMMKIFCIDDAEFDLSKELYEGKVHSIVWLEEKVSCDNQFKVLTSGPEGSIDLWEVDYQSKRLELLHHFTLPYTKQRWISAAVILAQDELLVCGDRGGTVHVYSTAKKLLDPVQSFWKLHDKTGVTDLCVYKESVYSAGRDGQYRIFDVGEESLQLLSSNKVYKGFEWIARLEVKDDDVLALGFHADEFVVYSTSANQRVVTVPCGGGHRAWDFSFNGEEYNFVYIKNRDIVHCQGQNSRSHKIIKHSLHGREICDVKHLSSCKDSNVVVTGGEDTDINILSISHNSSTSHTSSNVLATLQGHLSSVRTLALSDSELMYATNDRNSTGKQICDNTNNVKLLFSGGGRAQLKVWKIHTYSAQINGNEDKTANGGDAVQNNIKCQHEFLGTHSLTQKTKQGYKPWKNKDYDPDPETRYMDLSAFNLAEITGTANPVKHLHIIAAACSDSFVRVIAFSERTRQFQVLAECCYHDHCVLKVKHFMVTENVSDDAKNTQCLMKKVFIVSAATDGKFAIWDTTTIVNSYMQYQILTSDGKNSLDNLQGDSLLESIDVGEVVDLSVPVVTVEVHQSGVNAIDTLQPSATELIVVTGGDDNAITITKLRRSRESDQEYFSIIGQSKVEDAHATQVTGLKWLNSSSLVSVSIDQRLIFWQVDDNLSMNLKEIKFINVSDVSNIDVWNNGSSRVSIGLCGMGFQHLEAAVSTV